MEIYQVGGSVRDSLLGLAVVEKDWVVVGTTPDTLLAKGFKPIGKDFPVFLHPSTKEEYALARTERKTQPGYAGFEFFADPSVTLEEDLQRRDLTVNAMAYSDAGELIDPYGGQADLKKRQLRHVSPAFVEDPVRILRVARFATRFAPLGFTVAAETLKLMQQMVDSGEVGALVPERVWKESQKALSEEKPSVFFQVLREVDALSSIFPEIEADTDAMAALDAAAGLSPLPEIRFAALVHHLDETKELGKLKPKTNGQTPLETLCGRLRVPNEYQALARLVARYHSRCHKAVELSPAELLNMLEALDVFRRPERFEQFLLSSEACAIAHDEAEQGGYLQADYLREAYQLVAAIEAKPFVEKGLVGQEIKEAIRKARVAALEQGLKKPS